MAPIDLLVEPSWLKERLGTTGIKPVDATWVIPGSNDVLAQGFIPNSPQLGIDLGGYSENIQHPLPDHEMFAFKLSYYDIIWDDHIICYDRKGVFSAPRLWWTCKMLGHKKVSVLNGGLTAWIEAGFEISETSRPEKRPPCGPRYGKGNPPPLSGIITMPELLSLLPTNPQIVDARPADRFHGRIAEPRPNLRSGHIPGSLSFPYSQCIESPCFKPFSEIAEAVGRAGIDLNKPIIATCGSGVTAAGLAFIFHRLGANDVRVYDGSWAEWGASNAPIEV